MVICWHATVVRPGVRPKPIAFSILSDPNNRGSIWDRIWRTRVRHCLPQARCFTHGGQCICAWFHRSNAKCLTFGEQGFQAAHRCRSGQGSPNCAHRVDEPAVDIQSTPEPDGRLANSLASLPVCSDETRLSLSPLAVDDYLKIIPLGLLDPPQHVLPTEHIFYRLKGQNADDGVTPATNPAAVVNVRAPGNVRILEIDYTLGIGEIASSYSDYDLMFAPSRDQIYKLIHVTTINDQLIQLLQETEPLRCNEYPVGERYYRYCVSSVEFDVPVGTILGTAGGSIIAALDLEAYDFSTPPLAYANPDRYRSDSKKRMHIVCPLDGFTPEAREEQLVKVEGYQDRDVTVGPICGDARPARHGSRELVCKPGGRWI